MMSMIENFEKMLADGQDNALLRYSLGNEYFKQGDGAMAAEHLARAVQLDPGYSAAWKLYGKVLAGLGREAQAMAVYEKGIEAAEARGDKQAAKEMQVFLKRLRKPADGA